MAGAMAARLTSCPPTRTGWRLPAACSHVRTRPAWSAPACSVPRCRPASAGRTSPMRACRNHRRPVGGRGAHRPAARRPCRHSRTDPGRRPARPAAHFLGRALAGWLFVRRLPTLHAARGRWSGYRLARPAAQPPAGCLACPSACPGRGGTLPDRAGRPAGGPRREPVRSPSVSTGSSCRMTARQAGMPSPPPTSLRPLSGSANPAAGCPAARHRPGSQNRRCSAARWKSRRAAALIERAGRMADLAQVDPAMAPGDQLRPRRPDGGGKGRWTACAPWWTAHSTAGPGRDPIPSPGDLHLRSARPALKPA